MAEIVNLRMARKARKRVEAEQIAAENRVRFGRTRAERLTQEREAQRQEQSLDGAKRDDLAS